MAEIKCHLTAIGGSKRDSDNLPDEYAPEEKCSPLSARYVDNKNCVLCQPNLGWGCIHLSKVSSAADLGGISRGDHIIQNTMQNQVLEIFLTFLLLHSNGKGVLQLKKDVS